MNTTDEDMAAELAFLSFDCALSDTGLDDERSPTLPAAAPRRETRRRPAMEAGRPSPFLSIAELTARWGCGRTFTYEAIAEMEAAGYLKRLYLGRVQRVALESAEEFERRHAQGPGEVVSRLRLSAPVPKRPKPSSVAPLRSLPRGERVQRMREYTRSLG